MLEEIVANRIRQVEINRKLVNIKMLESSIHFSKPCFSLRKHLLQPESAGIIAEFKRRSPSRGIISQHADVKEITTGYIHAGASALSVLTEPDYFMGNDEDFSIARSANRCPILRKDFIVNEYQVIETKSMGADVVLLIAACLGESELKSLYQLSKSLGMEVLFEVHSIDELDKIPGDDLIVGVNNRNLKTMEVSLQTSFTVAEKYANHFTIISESGLSSATEIIKLKNAGFNGFLIGESLMRSPKPDKALKQLIAEMKNLEQ